jgi:tetratricopeptide (TPR) repeat protein
LNHHREALEDFSRLVEQKPTFAQAHYGQAWSWRALGDPSSAMDAVEEALSCSPDFVDALYLRGTLRRAAAQPEARADFDRVLELDPSYREAALARGKLNVFEELWAQAEADFSQAITHSDAGWNHHRAEAYHWRGVTRTEQGRHEEAIADLCRALELKPNNPAILTRRALAYQAAGEMRLAAQDFEAVKVLLNDRNTNEGEA